MKVKYGKSNGEDGPGVDIKLSGCEVATAIDAYLVARNIYVDGPRSISVNGARCIVGLIHVDPCGSVIHKGKRLDGRGKN